MSDIVKKLTTRNILALTFSGVFLFLTTFTVVNFQQIATTLHANPEYAGYIVGGGVLIGTLVAKVSDIVTFFFRKNPSNENIVDKT
jgi:hypothetical protein